MIWFQTLGENDWSIKKTQCINFYRNKINYNWGPGGSYRYRNLLMLWPKTWIYTWYNFKQLERFSISVVTLIFIFNLKTWWTLLYCCNARCNMLQLFLGIRWEMSMISKCKLHWFNWNQKIKISGIQASRSKNKNKKTGTACGSKLINHIKRDLSFL